MATAEDQLTLEEIRQMWDVLSRDERTEAFCMLDRESAQDFFLTLSVRARVALIMDLKEGERRLWMRLLPPDDAADVIQEAPEPMNLMLLELLDEGTRKEVKALLSYKHDVAGGLMNPRFARIRPEVTVDEAIRYLRLQAQERLEGIYYVFVCDDEQHLLGVMSFHDLFRAPSDKKVSEVMKTDMVTVSEDEDREHVGRLFAQYKFMALPVVDANHKIKGIITADDVLHAVQTEATEDIQKLGGMEALQKPYLQISFFTMLKKRSVWLAILFVGEMLTASVMANYETEVAKAIILMLFVPLIISSGGNSGSQATTLIIRAMALGEVHLKDWWRIIYREFGMGLGLGLILAIIGFVRIITWEALFHVYGEHYLLIAFVVSISLIGVVMWGTIVGSMLPFILRRFNLDPASASAPFVATLVDVFGIVIYFSVAALLLRGTLL